MTYKSKIEKHKSSTQDIVIALKDEYLWLDLLGQKDPPIFRLIAVIRRLGSQNEQMESESWTIKSIAGEVNETPAKVTKWLRQLYDDIWQLNEDHPEAFPSDGHMYTFYFRDTDEENYQSFNLRTQATFSVGDSFEWDFLRGKFRTYTFYVESITHVLRFGCVKTTVYFKSGFYNSYRRTLIDKGEFLRLISWRELHDLFDFQIDDLLR